MKGGESGGIREGGKGRIEINGGGLMGWGLIIYISWGGRGGGVGISDALGRREFTVHWRWKEMGIGDGRRRRRRGR